MKLLSLLGLVAVLVFGVLFQSRAEFITLGINTVSDNGPLILTNSVTINSNEVIEWVAFDREDDQFYLDIDKNGHTFAYRIAAVGQYWRYLSPIAGPATITVRQEVWTAGPPPYEPQPVTTFLTFEVTPQAQNPENSVIVLPDAPGAYVRLESSSDLQSWAQATNGVYADANVARFFRITLDGLTAHSQNGIASFPSGSRVVTLVSTSGDNPALSINEYETAEVIAASAFFSSGFGSVWEITRGGIVDRRPAGTFWDETTPLRGPATFRQTPSVNKAYCTLRITAEQYPPDKTLITLPGTNSYHVELQGSTDLKDWTTTTNGVYIVPAAMFFRIHSERMN